MKAIMVILSISMLVSFSSFAQRDTTKSSDQRTGAGMETGSTWDEERKNEFVKEASRGSMLEVQLAKLAQEKASSQQVKDFARQLEKDHSSANQKLKSAVTINIPSTLEEKQQQKIEKLSDKSGNDFDKEYIDMMVKDHQEDIDKFQQAQKNVTDESLKNWIASTLPTLKKHYQTAKSIQESLK